MSKTTELVVSAACLIFGFVFWQNATGRLNVWELQVVAGLLIAGTGFGIHGVRRSD